MKSPPEREVLVTHLGRSGDGVVIQGAAPPIHVAGALPGERVRIGRVTRERGALRAPLLSSVVPSPLRRVPACSVVTRCGGCPLAHLTPDAQREWKRGSVRERLAATGQELAEDAIETVAAEPHTAYRVRTRLAWQRGGAQTVLGYREAEAHAVVAPERCEILVPALEEARARVTAALAPVLAGRGEAHLALSVDADGSGAQAVLGLASLDPQPAALFEAVRALVTDGALAGASVQVGGASVAATFGAEQERSLDPDGRVLAAPIGAFRQSHVAAREALGRRVIRLAEPEDRDVLELHAGHGHFTLALAARARSLVANELASDAAGALRANLASHDLTADVHAEEAHATTQRLLREVRARRRPRPSLVVLDPPRTGASEVLADLAALAPERIVYVSCDASTFARDAARLARDDWRLRHLSVLDLFPDTVHVELVGVFLPKFQ